MPELHGSSVRFDVFGSTGRLAWARVACMPDDRAPHARVVLWYRTVE